MVSTSNPENYEMTKLAIFSTLMYLVNNYKKDFPHNMVNVAKRFALMEDMRRDEMIKTLFESLDIDQ